MGFNRDIKVKKINRTFNMAVRLYHNSDSYNRVKDDTPRFYLEPVKLNYVERTAFTEPGGRAKDFIKVTRRQWGGINETTLTDEQIESIYAQIKSSFPYGYVSGNEASEKKYLVDFKYNDAYQSHLQEYWLNNQNKIVHPIKNHEGSYDVLYPYIEVSSVDEVIKYKYTEGSVPEILNDASVTTWDEYYTSTYETIKNTTDGMGNCAPNAINISVVPYQGQNVFSWDIIEKPILALKTGETYTFNMDSPWSGHHPFRFSNVFDGAHNNGEVEYTDGVTKNVSVSGEGYSSYSVSIAVTTGTPNPLFFYCGTHTEMGGWGFINNNCDPTLGLPLVNTTLENGVLINESSLNVHDSYGFHPGNSIIIDAGNSLEEHVSIQTRVGNVLTLSTNLTKNHDINALITSPNRSGAQGVT